MRSLTERMDQERDLVSACVGTPQAFRDYLAGCEKESRVGLGSDQMNCPIAFWIGSTTGINVTVGKLIMRLPGWYDLDEPEWVRHFVAQVDARFGDGRVTAGEALEVLDAVATLEQLGNSPRRVATCVGDDVLVRSALLPIVLEGPILGVGADVAAELAVR